MLISVHAAGASHLKVVMSIKFLIVFRQDKFKKLDQRVIVQFDLRIWSEFMKGFFGCMNPRNVRNARIK